jgi:cytochrome c
VFASREQADHLCAPLHEAWHAPQEASSTGQRLFGLCAPCHSLAPDEHRSGPSLAGVFGREAGRVPGFKASPALELAEVTWDWPNLDRYLQDPAQFIPGQRMRFIGLDDQRERNALIAFLASSSENGVALPSGIGAAPACDARLERGFDAAGATP